VTPRGKGTRLPRPRNLRLVRSGTCRSVTTDRGTLESGASVTRYQRRVVREDLVDGSSLRNEPDDRQWDSRCPPAGFEPATPSLGEIRFSSGSNQSSELR
jgi:hypothetical protein